MDNVDEIFNTIHRMNTTLSLKVDRQAKPPSTRAIRRWIRVDGAGDFRKSGKEVEGNVDCCSPTKEQWNGLGYLSLRSLSYVGI